MTSFDPFARWVPLTDIAKSTSTDEGGAEVAHIGGVCSTADLDLEGEAIVQDGLDWSYFLKHGWFNYEHKQGPDAVLGHPTRVESVPDSESTRVEGVLYTGKQLGRDVLETADAMRRAGGERSLGFSVEGQILLRDPTNPKRVLKARVLNVAITSCPVNPHTNLELLRRSMGASVGYQSPVSINPDATLSPLIPQSLEGGVASEGVPSLSKPASVSLSAFYKLMRQKLDNVGDEEANKVFMRIVKIARDLRKKRKMRQY